MNKKEHVEFTWLEGLALCLAMIGVQLSSEVMNQWGVYFYSPSVGVGRTVYVAVGMVGFIFIIGTIWDAITDPVIGAWSDRTKTKPGLLRIIPIRGRRLPFIFWGSILMTITSVAFWYPPVDDTSVVNFVYGTVLLCMHWALFTVTVVPLLSLAPEIARSERARVRIGTWIAVGMIVGLAVAAVLPGILIELLDPARTVIQDPAAIAADAAPVPVPSHSPPEATADKTAELVVYSPAGYRRLALLLALVSLVMFQFPVWLIRERYDSEQAPGEQHLFREGVRDAMRNVPFLTYAAAFFLFSVGFQAAQRALPYWAELGLGGSEATVTYMMIPFILLAIISYFFIPIAARYLHVKWMLFVALFIIASGMPFMYIIGVADMEFDLKMRLGMILFAYCGIGQGIIYVMMTPMMGEIIDYDELRSGKRREALYNGLSGVTWKAAMAGSIFLATQSMHQWGNSADNYLGVLLVGPIAGGFAFLGMIIICFYPRVDLVLKTHD